MKTIGISLDWVLRDIHSSFDKQYRKTFIHNTSLVEMNQDMTVKEQTQEDIDLLEKKIELKENELISLPLNSFDLSNHYKFEESTSIVDGETKLSPKESLSEFMYQRYPFQVFGKAEQYNGACEAFNKIQSYGLENKLYKTILFSTVGGQALPATWHFLATHNCRMRNFICVDNEFEKLENCDILIDCVPEVIQDIPPGKKIIKIERPFNQWDSVEHSFKELCDIQPYFIEGLLKDKKIITISFNNTQERFSVFEEDYLNELKPFVFIINTGQYVENPNFKGDRPQKPVF